MHLQKKILALAVTTAIVGSLLSGCATAGKSNQESSSTASNAIDSKPTGTKIVVLTNNAGSGRDTWLKNKATQAGFNIEIVGLGAADITARVVAEVNNPTSNVVWGPSEDQFEVVS